MNFDMQEVLSSSEETYSEDENILSSNEEIYSEGENILSPSGENTAKQLMEGFKKPIRLL
ncbi:MAG: hypothetical protein LBV47_02295 [Bacteroidales bacterium]|jgi:hypothetical protein|nr:hypothetical protein [Bacteroidales bacterium]